MAVQRAGDTAPEPAHPTPPEGLKSRDRILWAASTMLGEGAGAALSVRAVAERAGVSTGSLRHHFPTQGALMDAMLKVVFDLVLPEESFRDTSIPPRDRLLGCVQGLLVPQDSARGAREAWLTVHERYIASEPTQAMRSEYQAMQREVTRRVEECLNALVEEGALPAGDTTRRARFLLTLVNGVSIEQVLPSEDARIATELDMLRTGVDLVLDNRI
ncbi:MULTISPECIES: TetR/AcrR family transcriptional regulator [Streptomyces]|uniref:TetR/AcrR family transcriptional regulator n=1 Tax=Streptomyces TaxID=1883 RepID=UPI0004C9B574|nr:MULTISPECIES: TetR/AcrR family transcriptional regulator [Streptomyces]MDX2921689.1 TetR/AcrR family transcriptional regulator [Streptomyces sp. NE06-03C]MDX3610338.1 TetR/AcrR family transcriptional regulator [Streptomyces sp. FL06-04B]MDX3734926.1 TetR/AcrR family transcriptional regulator [Streptomyces sp. ID01-15D]